MEQVKLLKRKLRRVGNGYHILVPSAFVKNSTMLKEGKEYDVVIEIGKDGSMSFSSPDLEGSYARFKKVIG